MGEDVRSIMESAGTKNLFSIPKNDENHDVAVDEDIPLTKGAAGPSIEPSPSFFMNKEEPQEEVSSVKDSVTSDVAKKKLTEGSTRMWDDQSIGSGKESTLGHSWAIGGFEYKKPETSTGTTKETGGDFILDPMVTKGATPQDYSASVSDTVSLVGKELLK